MDSQISITGTGLPLTVSFAPAPAGMLGIRLLSGSNPLPGGKLLLFANSRSQTEHWYQEAELKDGLLVFRLQANGQWTEVACALHTAIP